MELSPRDWRGCGGMNDHHDMGEQTTPHTGPDGQEAKKVGLPRPPFYASEYLDMAEILQFAMERFGQLILAIMRYTFDETVPEDLSPDLKIMFSIYQKKIDFAREKYQSKCKTNAENGKKGGQAKAANSKKANAGPKFTAPTLKQFRDAVAHFVDNGEIPEDITDYDADSFFDELKEAGWTIGGAPIQSRGGWEAAIRAKFCQFDSTLPDHFYYMIFSAAFAKFHNGDKADDITYDLMCAYNDASKSWKIEGESFTPLEWEKALARFIESSSEPSDT